MIIVAASRPIYEYTIDLIPFSLDPSETYYLSIVNASRRSWNWQYTDDDPAPQVLFHRVGLGGAWLGPESAALAFRLYQ